MALNGSDLLIAGALIAVAYFTLRSEFRRTLAQLRLETDRQFDSLTSTIKALQRQVAELSQTPAAIKPVAAPVSAPLAKVEPAASATKAAVPQAEEVTPEMLIVIAAAVTAFLGKKVRIRSAKMFQSPYEIVNPWSQQGRVFVQASHNLRSR